MLPDEDKLILQSLETKYTLKVREDAENVRSEIGDDSRASRAPSFSITALATLGVSMQWSEVEELLKSNLKPMRRDAYRILNYGLRANRWNMATFREQVPETVHRTLVEQILNREDEEAYEVFTFARQLLPIDGSMMGLVLAAVKAGEFETRSLALSAICYEAVVTDFGLDFIITAYEKGATLPETRRAMHDALMRAISTGGPLLMKFAERLSCLESAEIRNALK